MRYFILTGLTISNLLGMTTNLEEETFFQRESGTNTEIWIRDARFHKVTNGCDNGMCVGFSVTEGRNVKVCGEVRFEPNTSKNVRYREVLSSLTTLEYVANVGAKEPVIEDEDKDGSVLKIIHLEGINLQSGHSEKIKIGQLVSWTLKNFSLNVTGITNAINRLKQDEVKTKEETKSDGKKTIVKSIVSLYPKYKYVGYDWNYNYYNCISFSLKLIKELGVNLNHCKELYSYLQREAGGFWNGIRYYTFSITRLTGVLQIDAIQLKWVLDELAKENDKIDLIVNDQTIKAIFNSTAMSVHKLKLGK